MATYIYNVAEYSEEDLDDPSKETHVFDCSVAYENEDDRALINEFLNQHNVGYHRSYDDLPKRYMNYMPFHFYNLSRDQILLAKLIFA